MKANEKGFSVVEILIVIIVVGLLGAVGWLLYDRQKNKTANKDMTTQTSQQEQKQESSEAKEPVDTVPSGFKEYKNDELGFKFAYPESWKSSDSTYETTSLLQLTVTSPDHKRTELGGMRYIADGGEIYVSVVEASSDKFSTEDGEYYYQGKEGKTNLTYFSHKSTIKVDGVDALKGTCGHNSPGNCVFVLHKSKLFEFGYFQPNRNVVKDTTTPVDKYLDEFNTTVMSIDFLD